MSNLKEKSIHLNNELTGKAPQEILQKVISGFPGKVVFGTSLGLEDQVITDMIAGINKPVKIFTLDTGRLFPETYQTIDNTNKQYDVTIEVYFPEREQVETMVKERGINLFYDSVENRKRCCHVRKVEPLGRAIRGAEIWITGIRKDQTVTRFFNQVAEYDEQNGLIKINPLLEWNLKQVWQYIHEKGVPFNSLHNHGFPSIGCQPCTRAIKEGEDIRAGRWWWELPEHKECGLHNQGTK